MTRQSVNLKMFIGKFNPFLFVMVFDKMKPYLRRKQYDREKQCIHMVVYGNGTQSTRYPCKDLS